MKFFVSHHIAVLRTPDENPVGYGWENFFTELFAFYLRVDIQAAREFTRVVFDAETDSKVEIFTQVSISSGRPDICFALSDGRCLYVEAKVDAALGLDQLPRYLDHSFHHSGFVALFAKKLFQLPGTVVDHPNYRKPENAHHFLWNDLVSILKQSPSSPGFQYLRDEFMYYLDWLGFGTVDVPKHWEKLFEHRGDPQNKAVQIQFGRLLRPIGQFLSERGFRVTGVSHKGIQARPTAEAPWLFLRFDPYRIHGGVLSMSFTFEKGAAGLASQLYRTLPASYTDSGGFEWVSVKPEPKTNGRIHVQLVTPLKRMVDDPELMIASSKEIISKFALPGICA